MDSPLRRTYHVKVTASGRFLLLAFPQLGAHRMTQALTYTEVGPVARDYLALVLDVPEDSFDLRIEVAEEVLTGDYRQLAEIRKRWESYNNATACEDPAIVAQHAATDVATLLTALRLPLHGPTYI